MFWVKAKKFLWCWQNGLSLKHAFISGWLILLAIFSFGLKPQLISAQERYWDTDFWIDSHTNYVVNQSGKTTVFHNFTITNRTPTLFLNKYSIFVTSIIPKNISAKIGEQVYQPIVTGSDNRATIEIDFPDKVVGENKSQHFTISYETDDIAQVNGKVLEVNIPPISRVESFREFSISISTPEIFGSASRTSPAPISTINQSGQKVITFDKQAGKGVVSVYGAEQIFKLNLEYDLKNPGSQPVYTQITFPPDTAYQKVYYEEISTPPDAWKVDQDGNWLATYTLAANSALYVNAKVYVKTLLSPDQNFPAQDVLPAHTQAQEFWQVTNSLIQETAKQATTANQIYDFTLEKLTYTTADLTQNLVRLGALRSLKDSNLATCQEYTDLFITLARANKIPARRLIGYAQTRDQELRPTILEGDVLHAWAEYYDPNQSQWKPVDPTWGDTTGGIDYFNQMDLNHIVFAINGQSSILPYPVGSYQEGQKPTKTIDVTFGDDFPTSTTDLAIEIVPKKIGNVEIPGWAELIITNPTGQAWYHVGLELPAGLQINSETQLPDRILPFQIFKTTISAYNTNQPNGLAPINLGLKLKVGPRVVGGGELQTYAIPQFIGQLGFSQFSLAMAVGLGVGAVVTGSLLILGLRWANSLRRQSQEPLAPPTELQSIPPVEPENPETGENSPGSQI